LCVRDVILNGRINQQKLTGEFHQDDFYVNILSS
jgi:hypothetical protein